MNASSTHGRSPKGRRERRRCRQASDGQRLPCADHELAGRRNLDGRADRKRAQGRGRPVLRGNAVDPRRGAGHRGRPIDAENNPLKNAPHTVQDLIGEWDRPYSREQACYPAGRFRRRQILATGQPRRQRLWRSPSCLHLPAHGRL